MTHYRDLIAADRRLVMLRAMAEVPDYALRETVLIRLLEGERLALGQTELREEFTWLADRGLITVEYHDDIQVGRITPRGLDAAAGRVAVDGVARPRP